MKKPCQHCPYRKDVKPFLTVERGVELAFITQNPYNSFHCHKTVDYDSEDGEGTIVEESKMCAGFLSLQQKELGKTFYDDEGFEASDDVYSGSTEMALAYRDAKA
jgi:hypothetical protein